MTYEAENKYVRLATAADYARVDSLVDAAYTNDYGDEDNSWDHYRTAAKRAEFPLDIWVVCREGSGEIIGTISSRKWQQRAVYEETEADTMDLRLLAADPAARGEGVGKLAMQYVAEHARKLGFKRLLLKTDRDWVKVHRLYESLGWYRLPERDGIWFDGKRNPDINQVVCFVYDLEAAAQ